MKQTNTHQTRRQYPQGFELLELLITLGLVSMMFIIVLSLKNSFQLYQNSTNTTLARQLIVEEYEALRNSSYATLTNRTTQPFMNVAYNVGTWKVGTPQSTCTTPAPCSGAKVLSVSGVSGANNPSIQIVPAGERLGDGSFDMHFRAQTGSTNGWKTGFTFHYLDSKNYYILQATSTALSMVKVVAGTQSTVWTSAQSIGNSWHRVVVTASGTSYAIALDGVTLTTQTDASFSTGQFTLYASAGAVVDFDDVTYTNAVAVPTTLTWNFDSASETTGTPPVGWRRAGLSDLTAGATQLTISDAQVGFTDLKQVVLSVSWTERNATRKVTNTFFLNQQTLAP